MTYSDPGQSSALGCDSSEQAKHLITANSPMGKLLSREGHLLPRVTGGPNDPTIPFTDSHCSPLPHLDWPSSPQSISNPSLSISPLAALPGSWTPPKTLRAPRKARGGETHLSLVDGDAISCGKPLVVLDIVDPILEVSRTFGEVHLQEVP